MRHLTKLTILCSAALVAACGSEPYEPIDNPLDTAQIRGNMVSQEKFVLRFSGKLVWVPGTDLVAFISERALLTLDIASGRTHVLHSGCQPTDSVHQEYVSQFVAAPDGSMLYYTVEIVGPDSSEWVLRQVDPITGDTATLQGIERWNATLAVSPNANYLASSAPDRSVVVLEVSSGTETDYALRFSQDRVNPIVFSPDAAELLFEVDGGSYSRTLHRLSLNDGTDQPVALPDGVRRVRDFLLFYWDASGLLALAEVYHEYPGQYHVLNLTTTASVQVGLVEAGEPPSEWYVTNGAAWSADGTRVAYWTFCCFEYDVDDFDCIVPRYALYVADVRTGTRNRVAYTAGGGGPTVFSPDGTRIVYHKLGRTWGVAGEFYVVEVP